MAPKKEQGGQDLFRVSKTHLYEGGKILPYCLGTRWITKKGHVNKESVFSAIDLVPSILEFAGGFPWPEMRFDGEPLLGTLLGNTRISHESNLFSFDAPLTEMPFTE